MGAIIGVLSQFEDSAAFPPIPKVDWRFAGVWRFDLGIVGMTYTAVGPEISYRSDKWEFPQCGGSFSTLQLLDRISILERYCLIGNTGSKSL